MPSGSIRIVPLYRVKGYKISEEVFFYEIERKIKDSFWFPCYIKKRCMDEIPPIFQGAGSGDEWYSAQLYALEEPSLRDRTAETYRFTCLRSFHEPFSIRVEKTENGGTLTFSMCDAPLSFSGGERIGKEQKSVGPEQIAQLEAMLKQKSFRRLPATEENLALDGSDCIIETAADGSYHFVSRASPSKDNPVYEIGKYFIELSGQTIEDLY